MHFSSNLYFDYCLTYCDYIFLLILGILACVYRELPTLNTCAITEKSLRLLRQALQETLPRVASLLPQTFTEFENIISLGKSLGSSFDRKDERSPYAVAVAKSNLLQRDVQWIKENGICLDNIKAGDSVITDAGRGAKARRKIEKGDLIAPMPLLHIRDESELNIYAVHTDQDGNFFLDKNEKKGSQLLLNYCFRSLESSLLLCPTTNGMLVNHCSDECKSPNAELKWSADETTQSWLDLPLTEINEVSQEMPLFLMTYYVYLSKLFLPTENIQRFII